MHIIYYHGDDKLKTIILIHNDINQTKMCVRCDTTL